MTNEIILSTDGKVMLDGGREFTRLVGGFGEDKPMVTTRQIADLMGYETGTVNRTINRNLSYFENGIDITDLKSAMPQWQSETGYTLNAFNASKNIYALSQSGFLLYLKFAEGENAVNLYKSFIEDYFKTRAENRVMKKTIQDEIEFLKKEKAMSLGMAFMATDDTDRMKLMRSSEEMTNRITELEKSLTREEIVKELESKIHIADNLLDSDSCFDMAAFAKVLNIKGLGRNKLFKWLRNQGILRQNNEPYQAHMKYFKVIPVLNNRFANNKTLVNAHGIDWMVKRLINDGKIVTKSVKEILEELGCGEEV